MCSRLTNPNLNHVSTPKTIDSVMVLLYSIMFVIHFFMIPDVVALVSLKGLPRSSPSTASTATTRRSFTHQTLGVALLLPISQSLPSHVSASGGATAGKYTTIPIAKRRYYGRVQEAVHEYLLIGPAIVKGDIEDPTLKLFFDKNGIVTVEAKRQDINGACTKKVSERVF